MKNSNKGFTLIELLIVIAIIGILAAVLIPQLLGARVAANKRAVQAFSSNVYKVATAINSEDPTLVGGDVATAVAAKCQTDAVTSITVSGTAYKYGWTSVPAPVKAGRCTVVYSLANADFTVSVTGDASADSVTSINGQQPK